MDSVLTITTDDQQPIITKAELARHLGNDGDQSIHLDDTIRAASDMVEAFCLRQFRQKTYVERFHDRPSYVCLPYDIELKQFPVTSIDSITDAAAATVTSADYELINPAIGRLRFYEPEPFTLDSDRWRLTITYQAGFANIPDDLKRAVLDVAQRLYRAAGGTEGHVQSESIGDWSATYSTAFLSGPTRGALGKYRRIILP